MKRAARAARRLVVVSNRVGPMRGAAQAGGLAGALVDALRESGGLWFGWSGKTSESPRVTPQVRHSGGLTFATLDLTPEDHDSFYNGFSNSCLWPLFHFRVDLIHFRQSYLDGYRRVNAHFARALMPLLQPDDLIWVHDYHLFPLAAELRALGAEQRIGFFLHIPFPPADMLSALPCHDWLLRVLFDYDLAGFQTEPDLHRFHDYVRHEARGHVQRDGTSAYGRDLRAGAFPIGIDVNQFHGLAFSAEGDREYQHMRDSLSGRDQILCVDRLDYTKGLLRRVEAYEMLLDLHPEARGKIELLQVAPISRGEVKDYRDFRRELEQAGAHINGRFATLDWTPVRYLNRTLPRSTLASLYRASRIALVTPMRDGMNLVAKEYVAAQDEDDPGVLVLSRFAGAALQMKAALLVNPYDTGGVANALQQARTMSVEERRERHAEMMHVLREYDVRRWRDEFCKTLAAPAAAEHVKARRAGI